MPQKLADFLAIFDDTNKTAIMLLLLGLSAFFRIKGYISGDGFVELIKTTTISFFGTTTIVHFTNMVKSHLENKTITSQNSQDDS